MKYSIYIIVVLVVFGCRIDKSTESTESTKFEFLDSSRLQSKILDPIDELRILISSNEIFKSKKLIDSLGVEFINTIDEGIFYESLNINFEIATYLLENGYNLTTLETNHLLNKTKEDSTAFKILVLKYIDDKKLILNSLVSKCNLELLRTLSDQEIGSVNNCYFYDESEKRNDCHCACLLNYCEEKSVGMLKVLTKLGLKITKKEYDCLLMSSIDEGIPRFSKMEFIRELISNRLLEESAEWSPLSNACFWNSNETIKFLLESDYSSNWNNTSVLFFNAWLRPGDGFGEGITDSIRLISIELLLENNGNPNLRIGNNLHGLGKTQSFVEYIKNSNIKRKGKLITLFKKYAR